jgi:hypothetical protein
VLRVVMKRLGAVAVSRSAGWPASGCESLILACGYRGQRAETPLVT